MNKINNFILLDIHSFPPDSEWGNSEITILDNIPGTDYGKHLFDSLISSNVDTLYLFGGDSNDIVTEARTNFKMKAILIEFNERLQESRINEINRIIYENWLKIYLKLME